MKAVADGAADAVPPRKATLLHFVGGNHSRGGVMSYVRQLLKTDLEGYQQCVWKGVDYAAENESYVCLGNGDTSDVTVLTDVKSAISDFLPLYRWIGEHPNAVLYSHSRVGTILCPLMRLLRKCCVIVHVHLRSRQTRLHRLLWRMAKAKVIFNSPGTCRHFGLAPETARIHMPTIRWPNRPEPGESRLVACGAFLPIKNIHLIIEAFKTAGDAAPQTLHIYGLSPDPLDAGYQEQIIKLAGKNPRVFLHKWDESWLEQLGFNDIFIHASRLESFGIVMLEAFAKGCRMIVPRDTFLDDLPQDGVFCADLTTESLAYAVKRAGLYTPPSSLWESRRKFEKQFAIETTALQLGCILGGGAVSNPPFMGASALSQKGL